MPSLFVSTLFGGWILLTLALAVDGCPIESFSLPPTTSPQSNSAAPSLLRSNSPVTASVLRSVPVPSIPGFSSPTSTSSVSSVQPSAPSSIVRSVPISIVPSLSAPTSASSVFSIKPSARASTSTYTSTIGSTSTSPTSPLPTPSGYELAFGPTDGCFDGTYLNQIPLKNATDKATALQQCADLCTSCTAPCDGTFLQKFCSS